MGLVCRARQRARPRRRTRHCARARAGARARALSDQLVQLDVKPARFTSRNKTGSAGTLQSACLCRQRSLSEARTCRRLLHRRRCRRSRSDCLAALPHRRVAAWTPEPAVLRSLSEQEPRPVRAPIEPPRTLTSHKPSPPRPSCPSEASLCCSSHATLSPHVISSPPLEVLPARPSCPRLTGRAGTWLRAHDGAQRPITTAEMRSSRRREVVDLPRRSLSTPGITRGCRRSGAG
jgi:hypothetical protein